MTPGEQHRILFYEYVEDILERRAPHREAHLDRVRAERDTGGLIMAGALGEPPHGAAFVFRGVAPEAIEAFVEGDPYIRAGLVKEWRAELWNVV
jgi:hypothetical protein